MYPRDRYSVAALVTLITAALISASHSFSTFRFTTTPQDDIVNETSNAVLSCNATSGQVKYIWLLNGSTISINSSTNKYFMANGHDLVVMNVQRHLDQGFYRCRATNEFGSILSKEAFIQIAYFDMLETPSRVPIDLKLYESKKLPAPVVDSFPPAKVVWRKNNVVLQDGASGDYIGSDGGLYVIGASKRALFTCTVENSITHQASTKTYDVNIKGKPHHHDIITMKAPHNQTTRLGSDSVVFECIITFAIKEINNIGLRPVPPQITWYFNENKINVTSSSKYGYIQNGTSVMMKLIVFKPESTDSGIFKCQAVGSPKVVIHKAALQVLKAKVPPPRCTAQLGPEKNAILGDRIVIQCVAEDKRDLDDTEYMWYKNAVPIENLNDSRIQVQDGRLVIDGIVNEDSGFYQMALGNEGGECIMEVPMYLKVIDGVSSSIIPTPSMSTLTRLSLVSTSSLASTMVFEPTITCTVPLSIATSVRPTTPNSIHPSTYIPLPTPIHNSSKENNGTFTDIPTTRTGDILSTTQVLTKLQNTKKTVNIFKTDLIIWIASGGSAFIALVTVVIVTIYCCSRKKRQRKRPFLGNGEESEELPMHCVKATGKSPGGQLAGKDDSPENHAGVDTKCLLNDEEGAMYAPVLALENSAATAQNNMQGSPKGRPTHVYAEPITNTQRKPYNKPLPTIPRDETSKHRTPSTHSYLELFGPDECVEESPNSSSNGNVGGAAEQPLDECLYDCAREGVLTNTLRRLANQNQTIDNAQPVYHVLEAQEENTANRESVLYASPEDIIPFSTGSNEPLYHVLEASRPESLYQPLLDYNNEVVFEQADDNIYQPLDEKARSISAPSSTMLNNRMKPTRPSTAYEVNTLDKQCSRSFPECESKLGCCVYNDETELYQPLNNTDRCPLNVSKPKNSSLSRSSELARKGSIPYAVPQPENSSLQDYEEPTLHAIDVSPRGSLKKDQPTKTSMTRGHRRNLSDTHTIVNISRLTQRRASAGETLGLSRGEDIPRRLRRNHSDVGLCPIDLSLLRVSIDFESNSPVKPIDSLYMSLVKSNRELANNENMYSTVERNDDQQYIDKSSLP